MIKIVQEPIPTIVSPAEMKSGQVGVIAEWTTCGSYVGAVVVKEGVGLYSLDPAARHANENWSDISSITDKNHQIRILPKGTQILITL